MTTGRARCSAARRSPPPALRPRGSGPPSRTRRAAPSADAAPFEASVEADVAAPRGRTRRRSRRASMRAPPRLSGFEPAEGGSAPGAFGSGATSSEFSATPSAFESGADAGGPRRRRDDAVPVRGRDRRAGTRDGRSRAEESAGTPGRADARRRHVARVGGSGHGVARGLPGVPRRGRGGARPDRRAGAAHRAGRRSNSLR